MKKYYAEIFLGVILIGVVLFSFSSLTTKPKLWADEAKSIELARNFLNYGKLNIQIAPGSFFEYPSILQSTGYPVTIPLAAIFKLFGYNLSVARLYMLGLMIVTLIALFYLGKLLFGTEAALLSILLITTFASFYDSGRTVVGEIPGLIFLTAGLYFWLYKNSYYWTGLFWGLAVVTKPSVYALILPAIISVFFWERKDFLKKSYQLGLGMVPAAVAWILLVLEHPFSKSSWKTIIDFYKNPYNSVSIGENIIRNLSNIPHTTTLIYFGILFLAVMAGIYLAEEKRLKTFYYFAFIYSVFAFAYYLRSPGWLRYILVSELLILFSLPSAFSLLFGYLKPFVPKLKLSRELLSGITVIALVSVQVFHLFNGAKIFYSDSEIRASEFLNKEFPDAAIGTVNSLSLSALLKTDNRFQIVEMTGLPIIGKSPLSYGILPEVIVFSPNEDLSKENQVILENNYNLYSRAGDHFIYLLKNK